MDDATAGRRPDLIHAVFRARAATRPDSVALIQGRRRVTYRSLDESSDAVASLLHARGVGPGQTVPVLLASSVELVVALLAVLKCGAAYAALDAAWPAARQRAVVRQVNARTVIVGSPEVFPDGLVLPGAPVPPGGPAPVPDADITGADPAMVFFTSGTTGRPKAVVSPHRATLRLFDDCPFARFDTSTVMPQAAAVPWDAFALELWGPLLNGGTCVLLDDHPFGPRGLRQVIRRHGVDTVFLTTSLFHLVVDEDVAAFTGLRTVIAGGEELRPDQCARFLAVHPGIRLVNGYGPVESTVFALTHDVTAQELHGPVPLGRPVPHTQVVVVDDGRICDPDEVGELCIAGDGLAVEYLGDPAETAARFVTLTLAGSPVRLYRTGDRGSRRADGVYLFAGRADRQVKVRGHRVEPAAVERAADLVAGVRRSAAVLLPGAGGGYESMGLVYRAEPAAGATPHTVLAALRAELPAYSVPARVVEVAAFPLTPTGKLDTAALRELLRQAPSAVGGQASGVVARAFAEVLELTAVDPHTSLFELGGTSLSAIRICHRLGAQLGRPIPVSRLMRAQTVAALERWLTEPLPAAAPDPADDPPPAADRDSVPLSAMQGGFLLGNLDPEFDLAALCPMIWEIDGPVDVAALAAAVADVHHRHGYLSARYDLTAGALATPGDRGSDFQLIKVANEAAARRLLYEALSRPLVLADAEVWRVVLVQTSSRRSLLGIVVHHIAFDGWSEHVLARDLGTAYAARVDGCAPRFAYPVPGLADADRLQRQLLQAADLAEQARFWRAELAGVP
ncbi:amino acid adenylation domain-containing protein, partial [Micromonospora sonneratiae]